MRGTGPHLTMTSSLPPPRADQVYVTVAAIDGGAITLPERFFVKPADPTAARTVPSLAFLVRHPSGHRLLFDLGLRARADAYTAPQQTHLAMRQPYRLGPTVSEQLAAAAVLPTHIDAVLFSHVHWDHTGDPADYPNAQFYVGPGSLDVLKHGLSGAGSHQHFDPNLLPAARTHELPPVAQWSPLGPVPAARDWFGDGAVYVLDVPGHLSGHVNLLCRTGPDRWICLAGDAYHDLRLRTGERAIGTWQADDGHTLYIHLDPEQAAQSIARLGRLAEQGVEVIAAHDDQWLAANRDRMFPNVLT